MNERMNITELAELIAQYAAGKDRREVEAFLKAFAALVVEGVCRDKLVRVRGIGTCKLVTVEGRESVHVQTGERFLIPAHYKFVFQPDKELRDQVNKPFSIFETVEVAEGVDFSQTPEEVGSEEADDEASVEELMPDREIPLEPAAPLAEAEHFEEQPSAPVKAGWIPWTLAGLAALVVGAFFWMRQPEPSEPLEQFPWDWEPPSQELPTAEPADTLTQSPAPIDSVTIRRGDRLTAISLAHYGHKLFWVYIFDFNRDRVSDPNDIPIGTVLRLPPPKLYGIDPKSPESRARAAERQTEILMSQTSK